MRTVVIVGENGDAHSLAVAEALQRQHNLIPYILRMEDFPLQAKTIFRQESSSDSCYTGVNTTRVQFNDVRSVWWRRPRGCLPRKVFTGLDHGEFVQAECDHFLQGLLWSQRCLWVNDPMRNVFASRKIVQLARAKEIGLVTPRTLITNDLKEVKRFIDDVRGRIIFKRIGTSAGPASKTNLLSTENLDALEAIETCPTIFQEYVDAEGDIRVIWIDGVLWAIHIDSQAGITPEDSRFDLTVAHTPCELPNDVAGYLNQLMEELGLIYGAIDLRVGLDGMGTIF